MIDFWDIRIFLCTTPTNMHCSFDPIVVPHHAGNGLHFHLSPRFENKPLNIDPKQLTPPAQWLIAGLTQLGAALMAFGNRSPQSFDRLIQGHEVPKQIKWGAADRSALIRIPAVPHHPHTQQPALTPTIEFRLPDGSAHPHLLLAAIAQAMVAGSQTTDLEQLLGQDNHATPLPTNHTEIATALQQHTQAFTAHDVFTPSFIQTLITNLQSSTH